MRRFLSYIPAAYQERFDARTAVEDTKRLASLNDEQPMIWHLYKSTGGASNQLHLKLYGRQNPVILSKVLPVLENFGVSVISAQTYEFDLPEQPIWMQEYELVLEHVDTIDMQVVRAQFEDSLKQIWAGRVESDSFNELVLTTKLDTYDVVVLRQNYLQPQALELSHLRAAANLSDHQRFIQMLESEGRLDRAIEYLPSDEEIAKRQKVDTGLTNPELAVVMAYGKMWVYDSLLLSDLPDDAYFINELRKYFPDELAANFFDEMKEHRLHREIISTYLTNSIVNRLGIEALFRLFEETGQTLATIARGYAIARDVFHVSKAWEKLESLDNQVDATLLLELELRLRDALENGVVWFINAFGPDLQVADMIERFEDSVEKLTKAGGFIEQQFSEYLQEDTDSLVQDGLSDSDAAMFAMLPYHVDALDAALLAEQYERPVDEIATLYFEAYHVLQLDWMMDNIATLPQQDHWDRRARHALANELTRSLRLLMNAILSQPNAKEAFNEWKLRHEAHLKSVMTEMKKLDELYANDDKVVSLSTLSVLMSELSSLVTK